MNIKLCYSVYMKIKNFSIKTFVELICNKKTYSMLLQGINPHKVNQKFQNINSIYGM